MIGTAIGQLVITRKLGEGGMGSVYLAEHQKVRSKRGPKQYAVKILHPHLTADKSFLQRFQDEANAAAEINHEHIVTIHDRGELGDGSHYIVMDYVEGKTLSEYCLSHGPLSPDDLLCVLGPVGSALKAAHSLNIIHRDLKPDNILIVAEKRNRLHPMILDWGIAKLAHDGGARTQTGLVAGTPQYMAPEQMLDFRSVDQRADVYSLGVIAYQVLTGWLPHQKTQQDDYAQASMPAILLKVMNEDPIDPRERVASIPARVANVIMITIHRDPARRPQSVASFLLMLAQAIEAVALSKSGIDILDEVAPDLLQISNLAETVRVAKAAGQPAAFPYQFGERLGAGGMAEVYRATYLGAEGVQLPVAIKRVLPGFSEVPQFASMFVDEARLTSRLSHQNIVSIVDFDRDSTGRLFIAMELVEGCDLAKLAGSGPLPFSAIIFIIGEVLRGLAYAHDPPLADGPRGIVHRDMSPHNVLLSWEGAVKVSDFGIAKARYAAEATASTLIKGKPRYMSPEQASGNPLDGRSDLFAVGVILWELLVGTGENLFGGTTQETLFQVHSRPIVPPSRLPHARKGIPADLEAFTMRLLERAPEQRFVSAGGAFDVLAECKDFPRNGGRDLVRLMAERFPNARSSRSVGSASAAIKRELPATRKDVAAMWQPLGPTTYRGATGQPVQKPSAGRKASLLAGLSIIGAVTGIVVVGVTYKRVHGRAASLEGSTTAVPADSTTAPASSTTAPASSNTVGPASLVTKPSPMTAPVSDSPISSATIPISAATSISPVSSSSTAPSAITSKRRPKSNKAVSSPPTATNARAGSANAGSGTSTPRRFNPDDVGGD
jgi:serine/threonine protein kinase